MVAWGSQNQNISKKSNKIFVFPLDPGNQAHNRTLFQLRTGIWLAIIRRNVNKLQGRALMADGKRQIWILWREATMGHVHVHFVKSSEKRMNFCGSLGLDCQLYLQIKKKKKENPWRREEDDDSYTWFLGSLKSLQSKVPFYEGYKKRRNSCEGSRFRATLLSARANLPHRQRWQQTYNM